MSHWDKFKRLYIALLVFAHANAMAFVVVFGALTADELDALGQRQIAVDLMKCIAIASGALLAHMGVTFLVTPRAPGAAAPTVAPSVATAPLSQSQPARSDETPTPPAPDSAAAAA